MDCLGGSNAYASYFYYFWIDEIFLSGMSIIHPSRLFIITPGAT